MAVFTSEISKVPVCVIHQAHFSVLHGFCRASIPWPVRLGICFGGGVVILVLYFRLFLTVR